MPELKCVVLANKQYETYMSNEGWQLQEGLQLAGWKLRGYGYEDNSVDVQSIIDQDHPDVVMIQDVRDWANGDSPVKFCNTQILREHSSIFKVMVLKDPWYCSDFQSMYMGLMGVKACVVYYQQDTVRQHTTWLPQNMSLIRTYHSVDPTQAANAYNVNLRREDGLVSGTLEPYETYPMRNWFVRNCAELDLRVLPHPQYYVQAKSATNAYLRILSQFKVHVATASIYQCALRKIIESIATGCIPITNLSSNDKLPMIDSAIWRARFDQDVYRMHNVLQLAKENWRKDRALHYARLAWEHYSYINQGRLLSEEIKRQYYAHFRHRNVC